MSSLKHAVYRRLHLERAQPTSRSKFGLLEKHQDYVKRARDYSKKKSKLAELHEKARLRNPDEFDFKMIKRRMKDGKIVALQTDLSDEQKLLLNTQDRKYLNLRKSIDVKRVEALREELHFLDAPKQNSHTLFLESSDSDNARDSNENEDESCNERTCDNYYDNDTDGNGDTDDDDDDHDMDGRHNSEVAAIQSDSTRGQCEAKEAHERRSGKAIAKGKNDRLLGEADGLKTDAAESIAGRRRKLAVESDSADDASQCAECPSDTRRAAQSLPCDANSAVTEKSKGAKRKADNRKRKLVESGSTEESVLTRVRRKRKQIESMNVAKLFDTPEEIFEMSSNRLTTKMLSEKELSIGATDGTKGIKAFKRYHNLLARQSRRDKIDVVLQRMELRDHLMNSNGRRVVNESSDGKIIIRWLPRRCK